MAMLDHNWTLTLLSAAKAAQACNRPECRAAGEALLAVLAEDTEKRAAMAARQRARGGGAKGPPRGHYVVELDPIWEPLYLRGMALVYETVKDALKEIGGGTPPTEASLRSTMATRGHWTRTVDTDQGVLTVVARKATEAEIANVS